MPMEVARILHACSRCGSLVERPTPEALRKIRHESGLSLKALGDRIGVSAAYLSTVERGLKHVTPSVELLYLSLTEAR